MFQKLKIQFLKSIAMKKLLLKTSTSLSSAEEKLAVVKKLKP